MTSPSPQSSPMPPPQTPSPMGPPQQSPSPMPSPSGMPPPPQAPSPMGPPQHHPHSPTGYTQGPSPGVIHMNGPSGPPQHAMTSGTQTFQQHTMGMGHPQAGPQGRPTEASVELKLKKYGETDAKGYIPGAEVLLQNNTEGTSTYKKDEEDDNGSDGEWVDISHSSEDDTDESCDTHKDASDGKEVDQKHGAMDQNTKGDGDKAEGIDLATEGETEQVDRIRQAVEVSQMRLLTDEDFQKIDAARLSKEVTAVKRGKKRPAEVATCSKGELVSLADIENIYKKRRHDKEIRQECVKKGQEGREKFGFQVRRQNPNSSKTNREKRKTKNYTMLKYKVRGKLKRSFKEKQIALRNHLLRLRKMK